MQHSRNMKHIDLAALRGQYRNIRFKELIEERLQKQGRWPCNEALADLVKSIPREVRPHIGKWVERWMPRTDDRHFFHRDGAEVLEEIIADARDFLRTERYPGDISDALLYDLFRVVLLNYSYYFKMDPGQAEIIDIHFSPPPEEPKADRQERNFVLAAAAVLGVVLWLVSKILIQG